MDCIMGECLFAVNSIIITSARPAMDILNRKFRHPEIVLSKLKTYDTEPERYGHKTLTFKIPKVISGSYDFNG